MLRISEISFPGLGIGEFSVDSVAIPGRLEIAWYAIIIVIGMILAVAYTIFRAKQVGIGTDDILDYVLFVIPVGVLGARLYYVFTTIENYHSLKDVFNIRNGGLAIYGGILAGAATVYIVSKIKKIPFLALADCVCPGLILAQSIGRWGNFTNGEAFGGVTDIFCRMGLRNSLTGYELTYVHPTFLYESLWNILGFILINLFYKHRKYDGQVFLLVFGWYGLGRMLIEGLRADSLYTTIFGLTFRTSQVLAGLILILCITALVYFQIKKPNKPLYFRESTIKVEKQEK